MTSAGGRPARRTRGRTRRPRPARASSGRSHSRADSTSKCLPRWLTLLAVEQRPMTSSASLEHLVAHADRRPALADDVLVEVLAGAEAEAEAPAGEDLHGRGLLRDDRRVVAQDRARHVGHQPDALGGMGRGAEDRPRVARVALGLQPRLVVVADHREVEARLLGPLDVAHQLVGARLLAHHRVAEFRHACGLPDRRGSDSPVGGVVRAPARPGRRRARGTRRGRRRRRRARTGCRRCRRSSAKASARVIAGL